MPRKAAVPAGESGAPAQEPRRSSRIKDQPKPAPPAKKATKPRVKKADKEKAAGEEDQESKPKSARGRKRKEPEASEATEANGAAPEAQDGEPAAKKVRGVVPLPAPPLLLTRFC
jgi:hypothetical protein